VKYSYNRITLVYGISAVSASWFLGRGMDAPVSCYMSKQTNLVTEFLPTQHVQTQLDIVARGPGIGGGGGVRPRAGGPTR
jgi:hypothetical protein